MQSTCIVLYCYLWAVWLYHIYPHYLINDTILGKKLLNIKCVFWFYLQLLSEKFLILRTIQRHIIINVHKYSCKVPIILVTACVLFYCVCTAVLHTLVAVLLARSHYP
jgi:hypothetical protein